MLVARRVLAAKVELERARPPREESQVVPPSSSPMLAQRTDRRRSDDREISILAEVRRDGVEAINPHRAHGTWVHLCLPVHQVVDDEGAIGTREQIRETSLMDLLVGGVQISSSFEEGVLVQHGARRQLAPELGDLLAATHEVELGYTKCFASGHVLLGLS